MTENTGENGLTDDNIPWYLKIPIGEDDDEEEWQARPYFGEISIEKLIRAENVAISPVGTEVNIDNEVFDTPKQSNSSSKNSCVQSQNILRSPRSFSTPFDEDESKKWYHVGITYYVDANNRDSSIVNEDLFSMTNIPRSQNQLNIDIFSPKRYTSEEAIGSEERKEDDNIEIINILKQKSVIDDISSNDQLLERASHKQEESLLLNTVPSTGIHDWPNTIDQPYQRQVVSIDTSKHNDHHSTFLFEESTEFQPYNGTIDDLLKYSIPGSDLSQNKEETIQLIIRYLGPISLCVYIQFKLLQWYQCLVTIQASKRKIDHNCMNSFVKAERNNKEEEQAESNASKEIEACCKLERRALLAYGKSESVNGVPNLSLDQPTYSSEMFSTRSQLAANMTSGNLERVSPIIPDKVLTSENTIPGLSINQCALSSFEMLSTRSELGAIMIDRVIEGISPVISKDTLSHNESGSESKIPGLSHDDHVLSSEVLSIEPEFEAITTSGVNEGTSPGVTDIIISSARASMCETEGADFIKTLTSSLSQLSIDDQAKMQLAKVAIKMYDKERVEIRRINIEEQRRNEDACIEERRHQEKIKAMDLRSLRDEAQKAYRDLKDNVIDICIGKHQILCILIVCGIRVFKQNRRILKELTSATNITSVFEFVSLWACNCTVETCEAKMVGAMGRGYSFLVLRSLLIPSLSSVGMCSVLCILRILFGWLFLALVHKVLNTCKSPTFLHHLLNSTVFILISLHTDIGRNMFGSATIVSAINVVIAIVAYTVVLVAPMKARNLSIDKIECHRNMINLATRTSLYARLISMFVSFSVGFISA